MSPLRRRALHLLASAVVASATLAVTPQTPAATPPSDGVQPTISTGDDLLDAPQRGVKALRALGEQLPQAAARNDMRPAELRSLLREDRTAWVDSEGLVFFVEPSADAARAAAPQSPAAAPLAETFALHSNPGASLTILLDFDGAEVSGTSWNDSGLAAGAHPAWDPAGDGVDFSVGELRKIQQIWAMVAEDYAPFNVDVTTQDPGQPGMVRDSLIDMTYGTRVLVTPSTDAYLQICNRSCGGAAYISVFDRVGSRAQPAWVFPQALQNGAKAVAEAATHEAGHNLGLKHDGTTTAGYYRGHDIWAPIMGVGYDRPLVQWSAGAYPDANNQQDDTAVLTGYLGRRADEASGSTATATPLPATGEGIIGARDDVDAYLLGSCVGGTTVDVQPAGLAPNLDVVVTLHDRTGAARATSAPVSGFGDGTSASGLGGSVTVPLSGSGWVLVVEGVGEGAWDKSGYDDYGSLGSYSVSAPGCGESMIGAPSEPSDVTSTSVGQREVTLTWSAPSRLGGGPVSGYVVSRSGSSDSTSLAADARVHTFTGLTAGTFYQLSVRAVNEAGTSPTVSVTESTQPAPDPVTPSNPPVIDVPTPPTPTTSTQPTSTQPTATQPTRVVPSRPDRMVPPKVIVKGQKVIVKWVTATPNGSPITRYLISVGKVDFRETGSATRRAVFKGLKRGRHNIRMSALSAEGSSRFSRGVRVRVR